VLTSILDVSVNDCLTRQASSANSFILCACTSHELSLSFPWFFAGGICAVTSGMLVVFVVVSSVFLFFASVSSRFCFLHFALRFLNQTCCLGPTSSRMISQGGVG